MADDVDPALIRRVIEETGRRARGEALPGLAHPSAVDLKFTQALERATGASTPRVPGRAGAVVERVLGDAPRGQHDFNEAVVEALHQLDHRTRAQDERIRALEAEVRSLRERDRS